MKVIGAGFPKTGTKSFWHAMEILGYNHLGILAIFSPVGLVVKATQTHLYIEHSESPLWVDHLLDIFKYFMSGDIDFETVCKKIESMGVESCSGLFQNFHTPKLRINLVILNLYWIKISRSTFTGKIFSTNILIQKSFLPSEIQGRDSSRKQSKQLSQIDKPQLRTPRKMKFGINHSAII